MTKNNEMKLEKKYVAILILMIASGGSSIALASERTCARPTGHLTQLCGNVEIQGNQILIDNLGYRDGSFGDAMFMFVRPRQFSARSICKGFLSQMGLAFETATKKMGVVNEMYQTRDGRTGCRTHPALHQVSCENVSEI
jgi:hypothetical protein